MSGLCWLTGEQMARLAPFYPKSHGKPRVDDKRVLSGIIYINRNGLRWRDAPDAYGWHSEGKTAMIGATNLQARPTATSMAAS